MKQYVMVYQCRPCNMQFKRDAGGATVVACPKCGKDARPPHWRS